MLVLQKVFHLINQPHKIVSQYYLDNICELAEVRCDESHPQAYHHLAWMCHTIIHKPMSDTKANRWLGYVQGVLAVNDKLCVASERTRTRETFGGL